MELSAGKGQMPAVQGLPHNFCIYAADVQFKSSATIPAQTAWERGRTVHRSLFEIA